MDLYEKAHVVQNKNSSRKSSKSDKDVKKKLKLMLYGYRRSDNELVKESENVQNDVEDSSSVSGYSDLNITNSSLEGDITGETDNLSQNNSILENNALTSDSSQLNSTLDQINAINDSSHSFDSISEYNDDIKSLSEDISLERHADQVTDDTFSSNSDFIETSTDIDSYDSELEDNHENVIIMKKEIKAKKRKLGDDDSVNIRNVYNGPLRPQDDLDESADFDRLSIEMSNVSLPEETEYKGPYRPKEDTSLDNTIDVCPGINLFTDSDNTGDSMAPFVSINASDMESHSFSDILGEYRHPTIRNLPSDSQHVYETDNVGLFQTENMSLVDVETEDDVDSLVPEIDNDPTVEDIELETIELEDIITEPQEDSTAYDTTVQSEETSQRESSTDSMETTMNVPVNVYYGRNCTCVLVLKHPTEIYVHGKIRIQILGGSAEIMGFEMKDKPCDVYAPYYNFPQYIRTIESHNVYYGLFGKLTASGLTVAEAEDIVTTIGDFDAVLCMKPLKSRQMEFVENNFTVTDLFNKQNKHIVPSLRKASDVLGCSLYLTKQIKNFEENACWKQAIECGMKQRSRGIVCGGKGVGKSTFVQYYVNKMLAGGPVLVVDLDPGQCEFNVAGNISATVVTEPLLGPNFTHLKTPEMMLHIGMINTMDSPKRYAAAVEALISHCKSDDRLRNMPWIVNTMGMTNTIGLKFTTLIILHAQPTFLLQIDSKNPKKRYDFHLYSETVKNLYFEDYQMTKMFANVKDANLDYSFFLVHHTDDSVKRNHSLAPRDARYLNYLSYFGQLLNGTSGDFHGIVPYAVNLSDVSLGLNVKVSEDAVTKVINGKVVALCSSGLGAGRIFTLGHEPLRCYGAGLVRGVDWDQGVVYVVCSAGCKAANTLVYADWAPELRAESAATGLPPGLPLQYRTTSHYHQRSLMFPPRRRFNPIQLIKMSRNA